MPIQHTDEWLQDYARLKLSFMGYEVTDKVSGRHTELLKVVSPILRSHQEKNRLLSQHLCPVDQRIQDFLSDYLKDVPGAHMRLPSQTFIMDCPGLVRVMSLPPDKDYFNSDIIESYRVKQGVLHNPKNDRRTTQGVFHIAEGGMPIPDDKISLPKHVFAQLLSEAFKPPRERMVLPFTSTQPVKAELFASLLLRPVVCPEVKGIISKKTMEIRFFAPGNLVSNLDFVESIFGNAGDPYLPECDAALDIEHWTGHTGCVILAPHLTTLKKKDLGLPEFSKATERQKRDGMCWKAPDELYNDGQAFKATCRDERGVIVTVIADNYFGYCKKEVKTQISYAANLFGLCEEEHSGGAIAYASYDLGEEFSLDPAFSRSTNTFDQVIRVNGGSFELKPEGYAINKQYRDIILVPETSKFDLQDSSVSWEKNGKKRKVRLLPQNIYMMPSGYKIHFKKQTGGGAWHLIGTVSDGVLCHKPCTVSGGGKSEISKSIVDAMIQGPVFTADFHRDMERVAELLKQDYSKRFKEEFAKSRPSRPILSHERSLGSVIKLFTVSSEYTAAYNDWLKSVPDYIKEILFTVKRHYRAEWGEDWKKYFSVDVVNGQNGNELKFNNKKLVANYLRVGHEKDGSWRIFRVRQDYAAAEKIQVADDITASVVLPSSSLEGLDPEYHNPSVKFIANCEYHLFQRPDDAINPGYDKQTESDLAGPGNFLSNFEPLTAKKIVDVVEDAIQFDRFTEPMRKLLVDFFLEGSEERFVVSSAHPRLVDNKPSKNPRYLQKRPDTVDPRKSYVAELGARLFRKLGPDAPVYFPVNAVLPGRRNNPPDRKNNIPALAVYNPIHYQELPELFMDFASSLTGKSPSTTGYGSEGALTKGPFNALWPVVDLNNALVSYMVTESHGFSSAAGTIGPNYRVDHDLSLLMPEIWCRMHPEEQQPDFLIRGGYLEKVQDFQLEGKHIRASILGYRITHKFVNAFLGRIFSNPNIVFNEEMLAPEKQGMKIYAEGVLNILETQKRVAQHYFNDGSIEAACPPLKALLHIMKDGHFEGAKLEDPKIRQMFTRDYLLKSDWYKIRLQSKQKRDLDLYEGHIRRLESFLKKESHSDAAHDLHLKDRLLKAKETLAYLRSEAYVKSLVGTIGADPLEKQL